MFHHNELLARGSLLSWWLDSFIISQEMSSIFFRLVSCLMLADFDTPPFLQSGDVPCARLLGYARGVHSFASHLSSFNGFMLGYVC